MTSTRTITRMAHAGRALATILALPASSPDPCGWERSHARPLHGQIVTTITSHH